jgi:hypothetical protein
MNMPLITDAVPGGKPQPVSKGSVKNPGDLSGRTYQNQHAAGFQTDTQRQAELAALPARVTELERRVDAQQQAILSLIEGFKTQNDWLSDLQAALNGLVSQPDPTASKEE